MVTTVLIDDEPAAITSLRRQIEEFCPALDIVGTANGVTTGLEVIERLRPELLFLDIEMPDGSGFDLIDRLPRAHRPQIIFATSQESYALEAIRRATLHYLLKPVELAELLVAVELARQRLEEKNSHQRMEALLANLKQPGATTNSIGVPSETGVDFVEVGRITHCEGVDRCTRIHIMDDTPLLSSYSLGQFKRLLEGYDFLVVHRSFLVNLKHIRRYDKAGSLTLANGRVIPVSRRRRQEILDRLHRS